ncbi:MAG: NADH-quinone oxidoreductase subunit [Thermoleophilaceae bacterium]|jgi:NADH-quinone oxidoreductase subunit M|nr:NADH-quinone oxidoreductase subunit [Thermoleophilaceae bacterium]
MTIHLSIVLFWPLAAGIVGALLPRGMARWAVLAGSIGVLAYTVAMLVDFDSAADGLQYVTDDEWIAELGVRYQLGIDGLNLFMVVLTAVAWVPCTLVAAFREHDRPKLFFFNLALGQTAVLGAFLAQDLALFIVFFDLMLVPFYFMIGGWGTGDRVRATTKFVIYTLAGSLLMLAAAIALGVLSTPEGGTVSFSLAELQQRSVSEGTQHWIVLLFALAFFVKAPLFPLHGWVPETYRSAPIVTIALLGGVLSKVGVYGFLKIVLPIMPEGAVYWQELFVGVAVFSILYGSILAFTQDNVRLVVAYSSIAQMGFIVLGIFALEDKGAQGAIFQMFNHGLVVVPLFLIIGVIAARARGSESLSELGGMAFRAPVLAVLFLIVTFATLAMPGSANFVGELLVLFGAFEEKFVYGLVASIGVVLAAVYMIRLFQRTMHGRVGPAVESRDIDGLNLAAVAPLVAVIVALGVYPHFVVERTERATVAAVAEAQDAGQEVAKR